MATLTQNDLTFPGTHVNPDKVVKISALDHGDSLDDQTDAGFFYKYCSASEAPNSAEGWFGFICIPCPFPTQIGFKIDSNQIYIRHNNGQTFSNWSALHS